MFHRISLNQFEMKWAIIACDSNTRLLVTCMDGAKIESQFEQQLCMKYKNGGMAVAVDGTDTHPKEHETPPCYNIPVFLLYREDTQNCMLLAEKGGRIGKLIGRKLIKDGQTAETTTAERVALGMPQQAMSVNQALVRIGGGSLSMQFETEWIDAGDVTDVISEGENMSFFHGDVFYNTHRLIAAVKMDGKRFGDIPLSQLLQAVSRGTPFTVSISRHVKVQIKHQIDVVDGKVVVHEPVTSVCTEGRIEDVPLTCLGDVINA
jgi:hypothetical protein